MHRFLKTIAALALPVMLSAQNAPVGELPLDTMALRPVTSAYTLQLGSSHLADTYLSPIKFKGWHTSFQYERMQTMKFAPDNWVMQLKAGVQLDMAEARRSVAADLWFVSLNFSWDMMRRWRNVLTPGLTLGIGPEVAVDAGMVINRRNGNNPVSAKVSATVGATGYAAYNVRLWRLPVTLRYQASLPVTGCFFSPDYGELYYEIYLGNHKGLAHCAWWGNYFSYDHQLTADLHLGATSLRVGYAGSILSTKVNHIVTNIFTHAFVVGISGEWLSVNPRKRVSPQARMVSALF